MWLGRVVPKGGAFSIPLSRVIGHHRPHLNQPHRGHVQRLGGGRGRRSGRVGSARETLSHPPLPIRGRDPHCGSRPFSWRSGREAGLFCHGERNRVCTNQGPAPVPADRPTTGSKSHQARQPMDKPSPTCACGMSRRKFLAATSSAALLFALGGPLRTPPSALGGQRPGAGHLGQDHRLPLRQTPQGVSRQPEQARRRYGVRGHAP